MATRKQITLDTVYKRRPSIPANSQEPTFTVKGGTVNLYVYNKATPSEADPANAAAMVLDDASPFPVGSHRIRGTSDNILWESASGSPVVRTIDVIN